MRNWTKLMVVVVSLSVPINACASAPKQVALQNDTDTEADVSIDEKDDTNDFSQTSAYTEQAPEVDPTTGYFVDEIADGIYWVLGAHYQTMFFTTGEGVVVVDAPQPLGKSYLDAIQEVTDEPITHVIYSHAHSDHVGAANMFPADAVYIAHEDAADLLSGVPAATMTFDDSYTLEVGYQVIELSYIGTYHSVGDIVIYAPQQKVAMVVDLFHPGSAPFAGFGATVDLGAHIEAHDILIENYDFDVMIPGHTEILATKAHLETNKAFILSMQGIVQDAIASEPAANVLQSCIDKTTAEWNDIIDDLGDRVMSNCQKMEAYVLSESASGYDDTSEDGSSSYGYSSTDETSDEALPVRAGPQTRTTGRVPHIQVGGISPVAEVNEELYRRAYSLPGVEQQPTIVSLPGADGMWLEDSVPVVRPETIVAGREFAHIHPDGSLHLPLPYARALEVQETGWGERHPWAEERSGWEGFVMLYTPQSMDELEITWQLIVESYNFVTGSSLDPADYGNSSP